MLSRFVEAYVPLWCTDWGTQCFFSYPAIERLAVLGQLDRHNVADFPTRRYVEKLRLYTTVLEPAAEFIRILEGDYVTNSLAPVLYKHMIDEWDANPADTNQVGSLWFAHYPPHSAWPDSAAQARSQVGGGTQDGLLAYTA